MNRLLLIALASLPVAFPFAAQAQDKQPGQRMDNAIALCIGCHGIPGYKTAFPSVYHVPKIAGQQPGYIVNALKAYKSGERSHPSMRGIAATLTDEDMQKLADHYGTPVKSAAPAKSGSPVKKAAEVCAACHGPEGNKPSDPTQPVLAGQHQDYLERALTDYKLGRRNNPIMKGFASQLSKKEIEDLAAWFSSQKSALHDQRE
jgi:cytochrome c553